MSHGQQLTVFNS